MYCWLVLIYANNLEPTCVIIVTIEHVSIQEFFSLNDTQSRSSGFSRQ